MRNGQCPKCAAATVYTKRNGIVADGGPTIKLGVLVYAEFDVYICASCGYTESYIAHRPDLRKIAEQWQKVQPPEDGG